MIALPSCRAVKINDLKDERHENHHLLPRLHFALRLPCV